MAVDTVLLVQTKIASFALADHVDALAVREATSRSWKAQAESDGPGLPTNAPDADQQPDFAFGDNHQVTGRPLLLAGAASSESRKHG